MTQVTELLLEEGRRENRLQGIHALVESLKSLLIPDETIVEHLIERYQLTRDEAVAFIRENRQKDVIVIRVVIIYMDDICIKLNVRELIYLSCLHVVKKYQKSTKLHKRKWQNIKRRPLKTPCFLGFQMLMDYNKAYANKVLFYVWKVSNTRLI